MPPRLQILRSVRVQPARSAWGKQSHLPASLAILSAPIRHKTTDEKPLPGSEKSATGPGQKQSLHISEEAAATNKIMGKDGPDLEQGTPVEEVC